AGGGARGLLRQRRPAEGRFGAARDHRAGRHRASRLPPAGPVQGQAERRAHEPGDSPGGRPGAGERRLEGPVAPEAGLRPGGSYLRRRFFRLSASFASRALRAASAPTPLSPASPRTGGVLTGWGAGWGGPPSSSFLPVSASRRRSWAATSASRAAVRWASGGSVGIG